MKRTILAAFIMALLGLPGVALAQGGAGGQQVAAVRSLALNGQPFAARIAAALTSNPSAASAILTATCSALPEVGGDQALRDFIAGETAAGFKQAETDLRAAGHDEAANYIVAILNAEGCSIILTAYNGDGSGGGGGLSPMPFGGGSGGGGGIVSPTNQ